MSSWLSDMVQWALYNPFGRWSTFLFSTTTTGGDALARVKDFRKICVIWTLLRKLSLTYCVWTFVDETREGNVQPHNLILKSRKVSKVFQKMTSIKIANAQYVPKAATQTFHMELGVKFKVGQGSLEIATKTHHCLCSW